MRFFLLLIFFKCVVTEVLFISYYIISIKFNAAKSAW